MGSRYNWIDAILTELYLFKGDASFSKKYQFASCFTILLIIFMKKGTFYKVDSSYGYKQLR